MVSLPAVPHEGVCFAITKIAVSELVAPAPLALWQPTVDATYGLEG